MFYLQSCVLKELFEKFYDTFNSFLVYEFWNVSYVELWSRSRNVVRSLKMKHKNTALSSHLFM